MTTRKIWTAALLALVLTAPSLAQEPITLAFLANVVGYVEPCG
jgi:hypothetical protein